ncbi:MAG: polysaccharide deacetylase [Firmicutes bacterium]|nr:polysaccharide deacetylase [Bacillota bacterium]
MVAAAVALSACSSAKVTESVPVLTPAPNLTPAVTTTPVPPAATSPTPIPTPAPTPAPVESTPAIKWHPTDIGMPLVSDDPAAKGKKVVMLTFDDGPSPTGTTAKILDILKENNVKAMFFVTGYGAKNRDLLEREFKEGHTIGTHTQTHAYLPDLTVAQMRAEIEPVIKTVTELTGTRPKYFRPPNGAYNAALRGLLKEEGQQLINWSDGSLDWDKLKDGYKDPKLVVDQVMNYIHPGAVVLMHDTHQHTVEALPELIKQIRAAGYEFVVMQ